MERDIPQYTLDGVRDAEKTFHPFATVDGLGLGLQRFHRRECDDVVVLIHGLTTSSDMFIMPEHYNLVSYLLDNGLSDVWCLDFRMSGRYSYNLYPNSYSMDDAAYIPRWSRLKLSLFPFIIERILDMPYVSPAWPRGNSYQGWLAGFIQNVRNHPAICSA